MWQRERGPTALNRPVRAQAMHKDTTRESEKGRDVTVRKRSDRISAGAEAAPTAGGGTGEMLERSAEPGHRLITAHTLQRTTHGSHGVMDTLETPASRSRQETDMTSHISLT